MTTPFIDRLPSWDTLVQEAIETIKAIRTDASTVPGSDADILSKTLAHIGNGLHIHLRYGVLENLIPTKAKGWALDAWAFLFGLPDGSGGLGRIKARGSSTADAFTFAVTGSGPYVDLQNSQFTDSAGQTFYINESYTPTGVGTTPALDVAAQSTGLSTNVDVSDGETFTWVSTPSQMGSTITQVVDMDGGANREEDAELRARLAIKLQTPAQGGNWSQWVEWIENASPGALTGYVWMQRQYSDTGYGYGTTDFCALQRGESGDDMHIASGTDLYDTIDDAIEENAPVLLMRNSRQLTITETSQVIELDLELATTATEAQKADWDAEDLDTTIASSTEGTKEITCAAVVTAHLTSGDRVLFYTEQVAGVAYVEAEVNAVGVAGGASNDSSFRMTTWPWGTGNSPTVGRAVMSGGGQIGTSVQALQDWADSLGPAKGTYAAPIVGWDDTMRIAGIKTAVINANGGTVIDMTMIAPVADVSPGYDDDADVERLVPSEIIVWEPK
jgi:uncharacterized phage protein gp47/JayE